MIKNNNPLLNDITHELKNYLTVILQSINYIEGEIDLNQKHLSEVIAIIKTNIKKSNDTIHKLTDFYKNKNTRKKNGRKNKKTLNR